MDLQIYGSKHRSRQTDCHKKGLTRSEVADLLDEVFIKLKPNGVVPPFLRVAINGTVVFDGLIDRVKSISHQADLQDRLKITIHKTGKTKEIVDRKEPQELLVEEVLLNGYSQHPDKFGTFVQVDNSYVKDQTLEGNMMSLNGSWSLDVPVFRQPFIPEIDQLKRDQFTDTQTACFGCSFTYGTFLQYDQTWPYYLGPNTKNYGGGGKTISSTVGTAHWFVQNFKCDKIVMLLPHVCRLQLQDQKKGLRTFIPFQADDTNEEIAKDIIMFGEPSLLFSGYSNRMKELLAEISKKVDLYITSYQSDTYNMLDQTMDEFCKILPFYELSSEFRLASDNQHPGPDHNQFFANKIRPIIGG